VDQQLIDRAMALRQVLAEAGGLAAIDRRRGARRLRGSPG
jgi:hypothetical protein